MIQYTIRFHLHPDKQNEFSRSWQYFCKNVSDTNGLDECKITETGDDFHEILMTWSERFYLNLFMKDEWYNFLHGAVNVLGDNSEIIQKDVKP